MLISQKCERRSSCRIHTADQKCSQVVAGLGRRTRSSASNGFGRKSGNRLLSEWRRTDQNQLLLALND